MKITDMCRNIFTSRKNNRYPVYLNMPVTKHDDDIIGFNACAKSIEDAINKGAQMIAVTSPFGAGKTSVIELFKERRYKKHNIIRRWVEKTIHVPMWSQIEQKKMTSVELHKHLVYQIAKEIDTGKGTYIRRRLSENYGLAKIHINKKRYIIYILLAALLWVLGGFIKERQEILAEYLPRYEDFFPVIDIIPKALGVIIAIYPLLKSEIIISSPKSEKNRKIEEDEIIDLYKNEIMKPYKGKYFWFKHRYIIVIEDLDRSTDNKEVMAFLQELRKYYMPEGHNHDKVKNRITFIVNIKPESLLLDIDDGASNELIYAKLFDYILNIRTINIDDYETILDGLLEQEREKFIQMGIIENNYTGKMSDITGAQWLIRGKSLDIRKIKHRINKAVVVYQSLTERFATDISFEKCAVYAYMSTDFEKELYLIDDDCFEKLVEKRVKDEITIRDCEELNLPESKEFLDAVCELVNSKRIDSNYRMYFYNYPKKSRILSADEKYVQNAILYDEFNDELNDTVHRLIENKSDIIQSSLMRRKKLGLNVSNASLSSDELFGETIHYSFDSILDWIHDLDYSKEKLDETLNTIMYVLHLDAQRKYYKENEANALCDVWDSIKTGNQFIYDLRKQLCVAFTDEILLYQQLFKSPHMPISAEEYAILPFDKAIELVDATHVEFSMGNITDLIDAFETKDDSPLNKQKEKVRNILEIATKKYKHASMASLLIRYMKKVKEIDPDFEEIVMENINKTQVQNDSLFIEYQSLINILSESQLSDETLNNISELNWHKGYEEGVIRQLLENNFIIDAVIMCMYQDKPFAYDNLDYVNEIAKYFDWFIKLGVFDKVRYHMTCYAENILLYKFMFAKEYAIMTPEEYENIRKKTKMTDILQLIPAQLVDEQLAGLLVEDWNNTPVSKEEAFQIIMFISIMNVDVAQICIGNLDFSKRYHYYLFSKTQMKEIKQSYINILGLDEIKNRFSFMSLTKYADSEWISDDIDAITGNNELETGLVETLLDCYLQSINNPVLDAINRLKGEYAFTEPIEGKMLQKNMYRKYVESKILRKGLDGFAELVSTDHIWHTYYIEVFKETENSDILKSFSESDDFLTITMTDKEYVGLPENKRILYTRMFQDADCLMDLINHYSTEFVIKYLSVISGFSDYSAAKAFVESIEKNHDLLISNDIYNNTHEKLIDWKLKSRYTRKKNEAISMNR